MRTRNFSRLVVFKDTDERAEALFARAEFEGVSASEILRRALQREFSPNDGDDTDPDCLHVQPQRERVAA